MFGNSRPVKIAHVPTVHTGFAHSRFFCVMVTAESRKLAWSMTNTPHRACYRHLLSVLSFAFPSATVCHCILDEVSGPPHSKARTWSIT
jgi:hypothetical protein